MFTGYGGSDPDYYPTKGHRESGSVERKFGEKTTYTIDEQSDIASGLLWIKN
jgi:hypothetical protein